MNKILSNIGFNGPLILFVLVYILIIYYSYFGYKSYSFIYYIIIFVWQIFNYKINGILKQFIKQPRPANMKFINSSDKEAGKQYGMPSGHAQLTSSLMIFLILEFNNIYISTFSVIQLFITLIQRYTYKMHSISQLIVGTLIGSLIGYLFYLNLKKIVK